MLRFLPALVALLLPLRASAQLGVASVDDPLRPNRTPLAAAAEVPGVLLLGLDGPTAALVNPARAARLRDRFVYGTIRPTDTPVTFAGLFGSRDRRWLLVADNATRSRTSTSSQNQVLTNETPPGGISVREDVSADERTLTNAVTRARLLLVGRTDFGGYAFGLFGGYRNVTNEDVSTDTFTLDEENPNPPFIDRMQRQTSERIIRERRDDLAAGVEFAFAGRTWDLAAAISYQRRDGETAFADESFLSTDFTEGSQTLLERQERSLVQSVTGTPEAVDAEFLGTVRAGRDRDDYLFGAFSGTLGGGTVDFGSVVANEYMILRTVDGSVVQDDSDESRTDEAGDVDVATRAGRLSLGYVYAQRGRRMTVLAAINPVAEVGRVEGAVATPSSTFLTSEQTTDRLRLALELPLYLRAHLTRRLEAFGGGVYTYAFDRIETTDRPLYPDDRLPEGQTVELTRGRTDEQFASTGRLFAGAVLTLRSGLTAQAAFRGDLAAIDRWTVSLGYRF